MVLINIGDRIVLRDKSGETLGELAVRENRYGAWCGPFTPASGYAKVRDLFLEWTELVNQQCFTLVDAVDSKISEIDISAVRDSEPLSVRDVQLYDEGAQIQGSFRLMD